MQKQKAVLYKTLSVKSVHTETFCRLSHPKRDDDYKQPEEDSEDEVASEGHGHDTQESCRRTDHDGRSDLSQCKGYPVIFWDGRILVCKRGARNTYKYNNLTHA